MTHPGSERLLDLALGTLPGDAGEEVRGHLLGCPACARAFARLEEEQAVLGAALGEAATPPVAADLEERVARFVREAPAGRVVRSPAWWGWAAVAAGVLVVLSAGLYLRWEVTVRQPREEMIQRVRMSELKALGLEEER